MGAKFLTVEEEVTNKKRGNDPICWIEMRGINVNLWILFYFFYGCSKSVVPSFPPLLSPAPLLTFDRLPPLSLSMDPLYMFFDEF